MFIESIYAMRNSVGPKTHRTFWRNAEHGEHYYFLVHHFEPQTHSVRSCIEIKVILIYALLMVPTFWGIHHVPVALAWQFQASRRTKYIFSKADTQKKEKAPGPELCWTKGTTQDFQKSSGHWTHNSY